MSDPHAAWPVVRPVRRSDFDQVLALAHTSDGGMTNLPKDPEALRARIEASAVAFEKNAKEPGGEIYFLVLEKGDEILGTAAVFSAIGREAGFVNYKVNYTFQASKPLGKRVRRRVLVPTHDFTDCSEVGGLYLSPNARGGGYGKLLARARYLFIAQRPEIIAEHICAELRGWRAPDGSQPFWDAVGRHFFEMEFEEADVYNAAYGNQFIADLMPRYPIYACLLPEIARYSIGKPHDSARPALQMLIEEGFSYDDYVDVFDGGPLVDTKVGNLRTVRDSRVARIAALSLEGNPPAGYLLAAGAVGTFRCVRAGATLGPDGLACASEAASALGVLVGDEVRYIAWRNSEDRGAE